MTAPDVDVVLLPRRSVRVRLIVLAAMTAFVLIDLPPWWKVALFALSLGLVLGTYPEISVEGGNLVRRFRVLFWPVSIVQCPLRQCSQIEIDVEWRPSMEYGIFIGVWNWMMLFVFDRLFPWFGGDYKLWLRTGRDQRILAWQGNGEDNFRYNVEVLEEATGLTAVRA
jgi:hypothetical protein